MSTKVRILIGGGGITLQEMAAPDGIHYKGRPAQPSREKFGLIWWELLRYLTSCRSLKQQQNYQQITQRDRMY